MPYFRYFLLLNPTFVLNDKIWFAFFLKKVLVIKNCFDLVHKKTKIWNSKLWTHLRPSSDWVESGAGEPQYLDLEMEVKNLNRIFQTKFEWAQSFHFGFICEPPFFNSMSSDNRNLPNRYRKIFRFDSLRMTECQKWYNQIFKSFFRLRQKFNTRCSWDHDVVTVVDCLPIFTPEHMKLLKNLQTLN